MESRLMRDYSAISYAYDMQYHNIPHKISYDEYQEGLSESCLYKKEY